MKTNKQRADDIIEKANKKKAQRKMWIGGGIAAGVAALLVVVNLVLFLPFKVVTPTVDKYQNSEYYPVIRTLHELNKNRVVDAPKNNFEKWGIDEWFSFGCGAKDAMGNTMAPVGSATPEFDMDADMVPSNGYEETTDNQVNGVIEGDLFKRTNSHIFYLDRLAMTVRVYSIQGEQSTLVNSVAIQKDGKMHFGDGTAELYLSTDGNRLIVLSSTWRYNDQGGGSRYTAVIGYDVRDPKQITEVGRTYLSGDYITSRYVDGNLLLLNNFNVYWGYDFDDTLTYIPHYGDGVDMQPVAGEDIVCPEGGTLQRYTVACLIDFQSLTVKDSAALFSYTAEAYVSAENIFVTRGYIRQEDVKEGGYKQISTTEISALSYDVNGLSYKGTVAVDGSVKNQYSMDEYEGILRVVTTVNEECWEEYAYTYPNGETGMSYGFAGRTQGGSLHCIDLATMQRVSGVDKFIEDETVQSVRFDKEKAYVCTAVVITLTDPVFAFDLSDIHNITYVDTGTIEGYSTSLIQFYGGTLLGIGYGEEGTLKIEVYAKTETSVESIAVFEPTEVKEFSEEYKSYYIDREKGYIGLCVDTKYGGVYYLLAFDGYKLNILKKVDTYGVWQNLGNFRATIVDGYLYLFGEGENNFRVVSVTAE